MGSETDGQTDMARSTRLVILIKNIYTLWGRNRFLLPVTYFPTNLVYPFTLRVTGIKIGCFLPVTYFPTNLVYPFTLRVTGIKTLPVTYFPTNLVYPFTLRVTGIKMVLCWFWSYFLLPWDIEYLNFSELRIYFYTKTIIFGWMGWCQDTNYMEPVYRCSNFKVGYLGILDFRKSHVTNIDYFL